MGVDRSEDVLKQFAQVAEEHFAKHEREAAKDLIQNAFDFLQYRKTCYAPTERASVE